MRKLGMALALVLGVAGCSDLQANFPFLQPKKPEAPRQVARDYTLIPVTPQNAAMLSPKPAYQGKLTTLPQINTWHYRLGPGDVLALDVSGKPGLSVSANTGQPVAPDGRFALPGLGSVMAAGRSVADLQSDIDARLAQNHIRGHATLRVVTYASQSVTITGEVKSPGRETLTEQPLTLLQAIDAAGGMTAKADPAAISIRRHGILYPVDLKGFMEGNRARNNPILIDGDVVDVPRQTPVDAYLMGHIRHPGAVNLAGQPTTLLQALNGRGGLSVSRGDARGIFVFRRDPTAPKAPVQVYEFDARSPLAYVAGASFYLLPNDVVYVTAAPAARWKAEIARILPKVGAKTRPKGS